MKVRGTTRVPGLGVIAGICLSVWGIAGCDDPSLPPVPDSEVVAGYYETGSHMEVSMDGRIAEIVVTQSDTQLRRGGTLWAKVGPYVFLFSEESQQLLADHRGILGIRVTTESESGLTVSSALLRRDALTDTEWKRALNIAGRARRDGTSRMTLLEDLVDWGEEHTEFEYDTRFHH
jgi:hypothetical protein